MHNVYSKVAFVVTTHHDNYEVAHGCLVHLYNIVQRLAINYKVFFFMNEPTPRTINLASEFEDMKCFIIRDQKGGLTYTWNEGIAYGMEWGAQVFVFLNDDTRVDFTLSDLILAASNRERLSMCGPVTLPYGAPYNSESWSYTIKTCREHSDITGRLMNIKRSRLWHGVNGFCMAMHRDLINCNKIRERQWFDPSIPFGGNETEFGKRLYMKGYDCAIVSSCIVNHFKKASWRKLPTKRKSVKIPPPTLLEIEKSSEAYNEMINDYKTASIMHVTAQEFPTFIEKSQTVMCGTDTLHRNIHNILYVTNDKKTHTYSSCAWWKVHVTKSSRWNDRLRLKNLIEKWETISAKRIVMYRDKIIACNDITDFASAVLPCTCTKDTVQSIIALFVNKEFPTLSSLHFAASAINEYMFAKFMVKDTCTYRAFSMFPFVINKTPESREFIETIMDVASKVDWNFDFAVSWVLFMSNIPVTEIDPLWESKLATVL